MTFLFIFITADVCFPNKRHPSYTIAHIHMLFWVFNVKLLYFVFVIFLYHRIPSSVHFIHYSNTLSASILHLRHNFTTLETLLTSPCVSRSSLMSVFGYLDVSCNFCQTTGIPFGLMTRICR